ncbi:MAG: hypothetical protein AVDCRST_MAG56-4560 [uncultured Cytophagales bacterium]|uniref:Uncharacterized protein n=1 Tax=uncultured Cytophagales bacterium TaxID=158755 RepID=A0A6J4JYU5_9SPHI|nr:MAG: hypothetical protein AVDCRST_MAG56-4560 [uncultured Cytophagales bacterium]
MINPAKRLIFAVHLSEILWEKAIKNRKKAKCSWGHTATAGPAGFKKR